MIDFRRFEKILLEYEVYVDEDGFAHNDEGESEYVGKEFAGQTFGLHNMPRGVRHPRGGRPERPRTEVDQRKVDVLTRAISARENSFLSSILAQVRDGRVLTDAQKKVVRQNLYRLRMRDEADLFR